MNEWAFWYLIKRHDALWRFVVKYSPLIPIWFNRDLKRHVRSFLCTRVWLDLGDAYTFNPSVSQLQRPIIQWMQTQTLTMHHLGYQYGPVDLLRDMIKSIRAPVKVIVLVFSSAYTGMFKKINNEHLASLTVRVYTCFDWKHQDNSYDFVFSEMTHTPPPRAQKWLKKSKSLVVL